MPMSDFAFDLANPGDDGAILRLLRDNPVPGSVTVSYERSPSYFHGCPVLGHSYQTLVVRHLPSGDLAGVAERSLSQLFINGREETVGYLGQLRVDRRFRARWLVAGGFRFLRRLHEEQPVAGYLTTIIEGNRQAEGVLVSRARRGFPVYRPLTRLHSLALQVRREKIVVTGDCEVRRGGDVALAEIVAFLNEQGAGRQFAPVWTVADFLPDAGRTRGFRPDDFRIALRYGRIVGVMGYWDQSSFKQPVVRGYRGLLRWGRPLYDGYARLRGFQPLPAVGTAIPLAYGAFVAIAHNDAGVFDLLLRQVLRTAHERGTALLMLGLAEGDPLLAHARRRPHIPYHSRLYTVGWDDGSHFHDRLDDRISHVEIATL
jgi:hypothetical protein